MYLCGLDIGGTFTDCVVVDEGGRVVSAKAPSTPRDFAVGLMNALEAAARKCGRPVTDLLSDTSLVSHGTTVGTNAIVQKRGARGRSRHHPGAQRRHPHHARLARARRPGGAPGGAHPWRAGSRPQSSPSALIRGVSERVDCFGKVVVALNEAQAREAIRELLAEDVEAIAVCFLWSFLEPAHERRVKSMVQELAPGPLRHLLARARAEVGRVRAHGPPRASTPTSVR